MNTAQQIKSAYVTSNPENGVVRVDWEGLISECEEKGIPEQDWEHETTSYSFADKSVLVIWNNEVRTYNAM